MGQVVTVVLALGQMLLFARLMSVVDYAAYALTTAIWSMASSLVGSSIGVRLTRDISQRGRDGFVISLRDIVNSLIIVVVGGAIVLLYGVAIPVAAVISIAILSQIVAEVASFKSLAMNSRWRYAQGLAIRNSGGLAFGLIEYAFNDQVSLFWVALGILIANCVSILFQVRYWPRIVPSASLVSMGLVGVINLLLWTVATGDRILLGFRVDPTELASYALACGIVDRAFRTMNSTYSASVLPTVMRGNVQRWRGIYVLATGCLAVGALAFTGPLVRYVSGGNYAVPGLLVLLIVAGLVFFCLATPAYLECLNRASIKPLLFVVVGCSLSGALFIWICAPSIGTLSAAIAKLVCYSSWLVGAVAISRGLPAQVASKQVGAE